MRERQQQREKNPNAMENVLAKVTTPQNCDTAPRAKPMLPWQRNLEIPWRRYPWNATCTAVS